MRKLFKERKLFKGGNYMRKYGMYLDLILMVILVATCSVTMFLTRQANVCPKLPNYVCSQNGLNEDLKKLSNIKVVLVLCKVA